MEKTKQKKVWELIGIADQLEKEIIERHIKKQKILNKLAVELASYGLGKTFKSKSKNNKRQYEIVDIRSRSGKLIKARDLFEHQELFIIYIVESPLVGKIAPIRKMVSQKELKMNYY